MTVSIFYINGINNTPGQANIIKEQIEAISKTKTELIHNGATTSNVVQKLTNDTALGLTTGLCAVAGTVATVFSAIFAPPLAPLAVAATGAHVALFSKERTQLQSRLSHIQNSKIAVAKRLEKRVREGGNATIR